MIVGALWRPTWAFCSRPVFLVTSRVLWFVPRDIPRKVSSMDELKALVLGEVGVVLDVERGEGKPADEAAGGDPGVVRRPGTAAELGVGLDLAPAGGDVLVVGEDDECREEGPASSPDFARPNGGQGSTWSVRRR